MAMYDLVSRWGPVRVSAASFFDAQIAAAKMESGEFGNAATWTDFTLKTVAPDPPVAVAEAQVVSFVETPEVEPISHDILFPYHEGGALFVEPVAPVVEVQAPEDALSYGWLPWDGLLPGPEPSEYFGLEAPKQLWSWGLDKITPWEGTLPGPEPEEYVEAATGGISMTMMMVMMLAAKR